jgi:F-type H+-transporting ATPase subunit O
LTASEREKGLKSILGSSSSPILLTLLSVLSENGRLSSASKVFADFNSLMAAYRGELEVIVTSAEALDSKSMSRLEKALKSAQLAEGKTLKINNRVSSLRWDGKSGN